MECKYKSALSSNKAYCGIISYFRGSRSENGILQHNCHTSYIVVAKSLGIQRKYQPISTLMKTGAVKILKLYPGTIKHIAFIHSHHFYSASSSPLLLRSAPDTARLLCRSFTRSGMNRMKRPLITYNSAVFFTYRIR